MFRVGKVVCCVLLLSFACVDAAHADTAYVPVIGNNFAGELLAIDTSTNTIVATVAVGDSPYAVAVTPDGTRAYVANSASNSVSVVDTGTFTVVATVALPITGPHGVAITPDGAFAYVGGSSVAVIETKTNAVVTSIPIDSGLAGGYPNGITANPNGAFVYVALGSQVGVISTTTNTFVNKIDTITTPSIFELRTSPDGSTLWILGQSSDSGNYATVVDTTTLNVISTIPLGLAAEYFAFSPDGSKVYVSHVCSSGCDDVTVVDTVTKSVVASAQFTDGLGLGIAVTQDGRSLYILEANGSEGEHIFVVDAATLTVSTTIPLGGTAYAVTIPQALVSPSPKVTLSTNSVNFGMYQRGAQLAASQVQLTNSGTAPLTIASIQLTGNNPGDFANSDSCPISPATLAAGAKCTMSVSFTPTQVGARAASLSISDNAAGSPHTVSLAGTAVDFSVLAPASASIKGGKASTIDLTVRPLGGNTLPATVTVSGCPTNASCTLSTSQLTLDGTHDAVSHLTIKGNGKTPSGSFTLSINGTVSGVTHRTTVTLTVQ